MKETLLKVINYAREAFNGIDINTKNHITAAVLYQFSVIMWFDLTMGKIAAIIALIFGLGLSIGWEYGNKYLEGGVFSKKDILFFVLALMPYGLKIIFS